MSVDHAIDPEPHGSAVLDAKSGKPLKDAIDKLSAAEQEIAHGQGEEETAFGACTEAEAEKDELLTASEQAELEIAESRIGRILDENSRLCEELSRLSAELAAARSMEEELRVEVGASQSLNARQKLVTQNLTKNAVHNSRAELLRQAELAQRVCELREVQAQIVSVHRQLSFAVDVQSLDLGNATNRVAARARRIRRLELGLYPIVAAAQQDERLTQIVADLVAQSGTLVQGALSREAQRRALQIAAMAEASIGQ
jgi:hypothetical protein